MSKPNERLLTLLISKSFWLLFTGIIVGGIILMTTITHFAPRISQPYVERQQETRISPFTVRENTNTMWATEPNTTEY